MESNEEDGELYRRKEHLHVRHAESIILQSIREFNLMFKTFQGVTEDAKERSIS